MTRSGKITLATALAVLPLLTASPVDAQVANFSGPWSVNGQIVAGNLFTSIVPICTFQQVGNQLSGICKGPNSAGPASGAASGPNITWQWQLVPSNPIGLAGTATFQGTLGPDNVVRGSWTFSQIPYSSGPFTAQRV